jgi:hypothetical protein
MSAATDFPQPIPGARDQQLPCLKRETIQELHVTHPIFGIASVIQAL